MNYYERHLGDYAKDTGHLSMTEHGAYTLLLDRYYGTEKGIPADQAHRLARARTPEETDAVDAVLREFFTLVDGVWIHGRVEQEIEKASGRIKAAQENGKRGGRPRKETQQKPSGFPLGYENETQQEPSEKLTNHQSPSKSERDIGAPDSPTLAGQACLLMRKAGCASTNPSHPDLLAALSEGVTPQALADAVTEAKGRGIGNPFVYAIKAARSLHAAGASPTPPPRARAGPAGDRQPPKSRTVQAIQALNEVTERVAAHSEKPARLDDARTARRPSEAALPEP